MKEDYPIINPIKTKFMIKIKCLKKLWKLMKILMKMK